MESKRNQSYLVYTMLFIAIIAMVYMSVRQDAGANEPLTISEVARAVEAGSVDRIIVESNDDLVVISGDGEDAIEQASHKETGTTLVEQLLNLGVSSEAISAENVKIEARPPSAWSGFFASALYILPVIFMAGVLWFIFRQAQGSNNA